MDDNLVLTQKSTLALPLLASDSFSNLPFSLLNINGTPLDAKIFTTGNEANNPVRAANAGLWESLATYAWASVSGYGDLLGNSTILHLGYELGFRLIELPLRCATYVISNFNCLL